MNDVYDLTIIGKVIYADGLGRITIGLIDCLHNELKINCIPLTLISSDDLPLNTQQIISNTDNSSGKVGILTYTPKLGNQLYYKKTLTQSLVKLAYSMFESTQIPQEWVKILNENFDAVIVPDKFLIEIYEACGVKLPLFVLPHGVYLDGFQKIEPSLQKKPFIFGSTASFDHRKNLPLLIRAFREEFGDSEQVLLKINGRGFLTEYLELNAFITDSKFSNVVLTNNILSKQEYIEFMSSFNCYVNISKGEGFSVGPREALSMGIPCILSNNTAQKTLCNTGFCIPVPSEILEPAQYLYILFGHEDLGNQFNCSLTDIKKALREVYENYNTYLEKAALGRNWVQQYTWNNLKMKYLNLFKPKMLKLGDSNQVTDEYLMTNSKELYEKYSKLQTSNIVLNEVAIKK